MGYIINNVVDLSKKFFVNTSKIFEKYNNKFTGKV